MHFGYIYEIRNDINGKTYVGKHECSEGNDDYMSSSTILKRYGYAKYGIQHFTKRIIQYSPTLEDLNRSEELWIDYYKSIGKAEYNIAKGGDGGDTAYYMAGEQKAEWKRKLSESRKGPRNPMYGKLGAMLGKHLSEEARMKVSKAHKNKPKSEEQKRKLREANKGKKHGPMSEETKRKESEAHMGPRNPFYGKHLTEEHRKHLSEAKKDKPVWNKGKHWKLVDGKRVYY